MIRHAALTDQGRRRPSNQDRYLADDPTGLFVVADGMGGGTDGAVAAAIAVDTLLAAVKQAGRPDTMSWPFGFDDRLGFCANVLRTALGLANQRVRRHAEEREARLVGTTVVALWVRGSRAHFTHLGDSRLYLLRSGRLRALTEDHSLVAQQLRAGIITAEQARTHGLRNVLTQFIGNADEQPIRADDIGLLAGDRLLLCTDGLSGTLSDEALCRCLVAPGSLEAVVRGAVEEARRQGSDDNVTVVLLEHGD